MRVALISKGAGAFSSGTLSILNGTPPEVSPSYQPLPEGF